MQLTSEARNLESNLQGQTSAFTITANAQAFKILSANLYSNRPLAIIRELCSNAWDAHARVNKGHLPIRVTTPSMVSHNLTIRDFGPGLSHDGMVTLYTRMFGTDKSHSNDEIGGLGLGSKSPLSYTDQFTVVSYHNGVKRTYSAYLDESGMPQITLLTEEPTNETGLEVTVPSNTGADGERFLQEAERFLSYAKHPALLNGALVEQPTPLLQWHPEGHPDLIAKVYRVKGPNGNQMYAQMGPVRYKMENYRAASLANYSNIVVIEMPIGHIDIAPSRETISPTVAQDEYLKALCSDLSGAHQHDTNFKEAVIAKLNAADTPYDTYEVVQRLYDVTYRLRDCPALTQSKHGASINVQGEYWNNAKVRWFAMRMRGNSHQVIELDYRHGAEFAVIANPENKAAYKHHVRALQSHASHVALFNGTVDEARQWLKSIGFPANLCTAVEELTKPPKRPRGQGHTRAYGATKYDCVIGPNLCDKTADQIAELASKPENIVLIPEDVVGSLARDALAQFTDKSIYIFNIQPSHTRVIKGLVKDGCARSVEQIADAFELPEHLAAVVRAGRPAIEDALGSLYLHPDQWYPTRPQTNSDELSEAFHALQATAEQFTTFIKLANIASAHPGHTPDPADAEMAKEELRRVAKQLSYWIHKVNDRYGLADHLPPANMHDLRRRYRQQRQALSHNTHHLLIKIDQLHEECCHD